MTILQALRPIPPPAKKIRGDRKIGLNEVGFPLFGQSSVLNPGEAMYPGEGLE